MVWTRASLWRLVAVWLVVATAIGGTAALDRSPTSAAFVRLQPTDKLMHAARGDAAGVMRFAAAVGSYRMADTRAYVYEIYRLAPIVGLDPAILIGQSALETGYWRGKFWISDLNPAGIGIYDDNQPTSFHWSTGVDAARGHIYHLYVYAAGVPRSGHILYQYRHLTPGIDGAVRLGFVGSKTTIQSLEGSWALMSLYALGLCNKANEILGYAEDTAPTSTRTPTRTATPTPTPRPISSTTASDGNDPRRTLDRDLNTSWAILGDGVTAPVGGSVTYDLGTSIRLSSIRWVFRRTGSADYLSIRGSLDGVAWTTLKVVGNAPAKEWQTLPTTATVRYVRFVFRNPNADVNLGYLAEVALNGTPAPAPTATPRPSATATPRATATVTPSALAGSVLSPVESGGSGGASPSHLVRDGDLRTDWRTLASPPPSRAFVYLDLGGTATLTGARWYLSQAGCGAVLTIEGSSDKLTWSPLATGSTADAGAWRTAAFDATARYLRFLFQTPGTAAALGCLAEAQAWGTQVTAAEESPTVTATAAVSPTATASVPAPSTTATPVASPSPTADATTEPEPTVESTPTSTIEPPTATPLPPTDTPDPPTETPTATPEVSGPPGEASIEDANVTPEGDASTGGEG